MKSSVNITTTYHFDVSYNNLSAAQINNILQTIDGYTTQSGTNFTDKFIDVSGGGNATPTRAGLTSLVLETKVIEFSQIKIMKYIIINLISAVLDLYALYVHKTSNYIMLIFNRKILL